MYTLFPIAPLYPDGFQYLLNFISQQEEDELLNMIGTLQLNAFQFQGYAARRSVASFGYDWNFDKQQLAKGKDIPAGFHWLINKVAAACMLPANKVKELLVTAYPIGSVINWHRDAPPFAVIAGVSLNADCTFRLRPYAKEKQGKKAIVSLPMERRSLYVLQGEARSDWQHSIAAVTSVRYSITLRTLKDKALQV